MSRLDKHRRLPAIAVFAALVASPPVVFSQAPAQSSTAGPANLESGRRFAAFAASANSRRSWRLPHDASALPGCD